MRQSFSHRGPGLLSVMLLFVLGGCAAKDDVAPVDVEKQAFDDLRTEIREAIDDPAREDEAIAQVDALVKELDELRERVADRKKRIRQLNADYDTSRADFEKFFEKVNMEIRSNRQRVGDSHRALRASTTPEEWSQISKARTKAMNSVIRSMQTT